MKNNDDHHFPIVSAPSVLPHLDIAQGFST